MINWHDVLYLIFRYAGQAGFVVLGIRDVKKAVLGDIYHKVGFNTEEMVPQEYAFKQPTPMVRWFFLN